MLRIFKILSLLGNALLMVAALGITVSMFALRPNSARVDAEEYLVLSDYIRQGLTGESHSLGSTEGIVVIEGQTMGSQNL
jgi:hypothetical protein